MLGSLVGEPLGDEKALALRVIDSRAESFCRLVDRNLDGSYRLAAGILGDRVEAEDAVHDAAVAAWRGFHELRDPDRFDAWFRRILVNGCRVLMHVAAWSTWDASSSRPSTPGSPTPPRRRQSATLSVAPSMPWGLTNGSWSHCASTRT